MKFWRLHSPDYESDYEASYVNGHLEHPFGLPGVDCSICGVSWGGSRILPYECPSDMRNSKCLRDSWPISLDEHKGLQKKMLCKLRGQGVTISELVPGDEFQPCYLDVPSKPVADFLWASPGSLVVSQRIKNLLVERWSDDIGWYKVVLRKIGKGRAKSPPPIPSTGEPGDIIEEVPLAKPSSDVGPYFEICVQKESGWPPGGEPKEICPGCKRAKINDSTRQIRMTQQMWRGNAIFFLATTLYVIVTDDLKRIIEEAQPTNVVFSEMWQIEKIPNR